MAGEVKLSLLVEANARQAKGEVAATVKAVKELTGATRESGQSSRSASDDAAEFGAAVSRLRAEIQGLTALEAQAATQLASLGGAGKGASADAKALDAELKLLRGSLAGLTEVEAKAVAATRGAAESFDQVRASLDPLYALQRQYEQVQEQVTQAVRLGAVTQAQANEVLAGARTQYNNAVDGLRAMGAAGRSFDGRGLAMQLSQVAQQTSATGDVTQALAIQLPDMALGFGPVGIAAGVAAGALLPLIANAVGFGDAAEDQAEQVAEAKETIDAYREAVQAAAASDRDIAGLYGPAVAQGRELLQVRRDLARLDAERSLISTNEQVDDMTGGFALYSGDAVLARLRESAEVYAEIERLRDEARAASAAGDEAGYFGATDEIAVLQARLGGMESLVERVRDLAGTLGVGEVAAAQLGAALAAVDDAAVPEQQAEAWRAARAALIDAVGGYEALNESGRKLLDLTIAGEEAVLQLAAARRADEGAAEGMLADLQNQAAVQDLIARYGEDSAQVAAERAAQERKAQAALVESLVVSEEMKAELMAAWDAANGLAGAAGAINFDGAAGSAAAIARNLSVALSVAQALAATPYAEGLATASDGRGSQREARQEGQAFTTDRILDEQAELPWRRELNRGLSGLGGGGGGSGGGGGGGGAPERDPVADLVSSLEDELALLRETDPVQQELLRHREDLAGATDAQRAEAEGLIRTIDAETAANERLEDGLRDVRAAGDDLLGGLIDDAREGLSLMDTLGNAAERLGDRLLDMAADTLGTALFGTGKRGGGTGLLGGLMSGLLGFGGKAFATGGVVDGPTLFGFGAGQLGLMGEAGPEAILPLTGGGVGATFGGVEATLPLARLSSGKLGVRAFADGGVFGGMIEPAPAPWRQAARPEGGDRDGGRATTVTIKVDVTGARGDKDIQAMVAAGVQQGLGEYDRVLPDRVKGITTDWRHT